MKFADSTVLWIFILWLIVVAARLAFNLWRAYRRENHRSTVTSELLANPSAGNASRYEALLECEAACSPIVPASISRRLRSETSRRWW